MKNLNELNSINAIFFNEIRLIIIGDMNDL